MNSLPLSGEKHFCRGRGGIVHERHPLHGVPDDYRILPNGDRCCTFCGSWHLEDFERFCKAVVDGSAPAGSAVYGTDKTYKVYAKQPDIRNASEGAIKFYADHQPEQNCDEHINLVHAALKISLKTP